jgi:hypothetical protein
LERYRRQFEREIAHARVADIDDFACTAIRLADEEASHGLERFLRGRQTDPYRFVLAECIEPFKGQCKMAAPFGAGHRVDFIDDHGARRREHAAAGIGTEQHVERLGRGHKDMRGPLPERVAFLLGGVPGTHGGADLDGWEIQALHFLSDAGKRILQVDADVVGKRFERRDVDHGCLVRQRPAVCEAFAYQVVDGGQECSQRFA